MNSPTRPLYNYCLSYYFFFIPFTLPTQHIFYYISLPETPDPHPFFSPTIASLHLAPPHHLLSTESEPSPAAQVTFSPTSTPGSRCRIVRRQTSTARSGPRPRSKPGSRSGPRSTSTKRHPRLSGHLTVDISLDEEEEEEKKEEEKEEEEEKEAEEEKEEEQEKNDDLSGDDNSDS